MTGMRKLLHPAGFRSLALLCFTLTALTLSAQEDCINGVDDDSDGLIDLNDPDCTCYVTSPDTVYGDFEDFSCCPTTFTGAGQGIECLEGWSQSGLATSDYFNTCDYVGGAGVPFMPLPPPSGEGAVGFITMPGWSEYVGQCMPTAMLNGETYEMEFYLGFNDDIIWQSNSPFTIGIYGTTSCDNYPMTGSICPTSNANWFELGTHTVMGSDSSWTFASFSFTVTQDIEAIAIGGACSEIGGVAEYHFIDGIVISGNFGGEVVEVEDPTLSGDCVSGVEVEVPNVPGATYQWFLDGVAIPGATTNPYNVPVGGDGEYTVLVDNGFGCGISDPIDVTVEANVLDVDGIVEDVDCNGNATGSIEIDLPTDNEPIDVEWGTGQMTNEITDLLPGTYSVTITDANGCFGVETFFVTQPDEPLMVQMTNVEQPIGSGALGSAEVVTNGGTPPYSYLWDNGETTAVATMLEPGLHTVTITDANGCEETLEVLIYEALEFILTIVDETCYNACDGSIELEVSGGLENYTYEWDNGGSAPINMGLCQGIYIVTITDAAGSEIIEDFEVTGPEDLVIVGMWTDVICSGQDGYITTEVLGGTPDYSYIWSNGETTSDIYNLTGTDYSLTVTDAQGCTAVENFQIVVLDSLLITGVVTDESCGGGGNGEIDISLGNGIPPYTYLWSNGFNGEDIDGLVSGTYSVTVADDQGCEGSASFFVGAGGDLDVVVTITDASCNGVDDGAIDLDVSGGVEPYTYTWDSGASDAQITDLASGTYSVTIEDSGGCTWTDAIDVGAGAGVELEGVVADASCWMGTDGAVDITVTSGAPTFTYIWSTGASTEDLPAVAAGIYTVTVTDANGCSAESSFDVISPGAIDITGVTADASCSNGMDGSVDITVSGGASPYSFLWSNSDMTEDLGGVIPGDYTVTVTDAAGCTGVATYTVMASTDLEISSSVTSASCNGGTDGAIDITVSGGTPPYTYNWSTSASSEDISGLAAGAYTVTVTDDRGCELIEQIDVFGAGSMSIQGAVFDISCPGANDGAIDVEVTGGTAPYTFLWTGGSTSEDLTGIGAGTYEVTVTDDQGCEISEQFTIEDIEPIVANLSATDVACNGNADGTAEVVVTGGTGPYGYAWNNGGTSAAISGLSAGTYTVTITDLNGCQEVGQVDVAEPPLLDISISSITNPTMAGEFGAAEVVVTGGVSPYTINWGNGETGPVASQLPIGTTTVEAVDANGCSIFIDVEITVEAFSVNYDLQNNACFGECLGTIELQVSGGLPPYEFEWSDGQTGQNATGLCNGIYSVTITDGAGQVILEPLEVISPPELVVNGIASDPTCIDNIDGEILLDVSGGTEPYDVLWSTGSDLLALTDLQPADYSVTVTDLHGCQTAALYTLDAVEALDLTLAARNIDCDNAQGALLIGGENPYGYQYLVNNQAVQPQGDSLVAALPVGTYTLAYQVNAGCVVEVGTTSIIEESNFVVSVKPNLSVVKPGESVELRLEITGVIGAHSIDWIVSDDYTCIEEDASGNCIAISFVPSSAQTVVAQVVDASDCSGLAEAVIQVEADRVVYVPNVFSPNGDGINDVFRPQANDELASIDNFRIFTRWGEQVYEEANLPAAALSGWDGSYKGQEVMPGVYVFTIDITFGDGVSRTEKGDVTVIR